MSKSDDYATGNLLDYIKYHRFFGIDLSRQANSSIPEQINFLGKLEEGHGATWFFIA